MLHSCMYIYIYVCIRNVAYIYIHKYIVRCLCIWISYGPVLDSGGVLWAPVCMANYRRIPK